MAIVRLAISNVTRRLSRSVLTVLAMAVAGVVVTSGLSLSHGLPRSAYTVYREYLSGDIMVYTPSFIGASPISSAAAGITRRTMVDSGFNPLITMYPEIREKGYLAQEDWEYRPMAPKEIEQLADFPGIVEVNLHKAMPVAIANTFFSLRPLTASMLRYISDGRAPNVGHEVLEVVLNKYPDMEEIIDQGVKVGELIDIDLPTYRVDSWGLPYVDATAPIKRVPAKVVGFVTVPTRSVTWKGPVDAIMHEQGYLHTHEVFLHPDSWEMLWRERSGAVEYPVLAVGLTVENMTQLFTTTSQLRSSFPQYSVFAVPQLAVRAEQLALLDRFYQAPQHVWRVAQQGELPLAQEDFGRITAIMLFVNAGMLMASQMLAAVSSRRTEIGILKSIGARGREVTLMIMVEAVMLAVIGAASGFLVVRLAGIYQSIVANTSVLSIIATTLREMGIVLAITVSCSLLFGVLPAWKVTKYSVMEVFRNE